MLDQNCKGRPCQQRLLCIHFSDYIKLISIHQVILTIKIVSEFQHTLFTVLCYGLTVLIPRPCSQQLSETVLPRTMMDCWDRATTVVSSQRISSDLGDCATDAVKGKNRCGDLGPRIRTAGDCTTVYAIGD